MFLLRHYKSSGGCLFMNCSGEIPFHGKSQCHGGVGCASGALHDMISREICVEMAAETRLDPKVIG
jgi:hypothetical protein